MWSFAKLYFFHHFLFLGIHHQQLVGFLSNYVKPATILRYFQVVRRDIGLMHHLGNDIVLLGIDVTAPAGNGMIIRCSHVVHMSPGCAVPDDRPCHDHQGNGCYNEYGFDTYHIASSSY